MGALLTLASLHARAGLTVHVSATGLVGVTNQSYLVSQAAAPRDNSERIFFRVAPVCTSPVGHTTERDNTRAPSSGLANR